MELYDARGAHLDEHDGRPAELVRAIEAIVFAADEPVTDSGGNDE